MSQRTLLAMTQYKINQPREAAKLRVIAKQTELRDDSSVLKKILFKKNKELECFTTVRRGSGLTLSLEPVAH